MNLQELFNKTKELIDRGIDPKTPVLIEVQDDRHVFKKHDGTANTVYYNGYQIMISD